MNPIIRVVDFETTGLDPTDKVIEMGWTDLEKTEDGWRVMEDTPQSRLYRVDQIPPEARAVHHIAVGDTLDGVPFEPFFLWGHAKLCGVSVVASHNAAYDGQYWGPPELPVLCTYKAALRVWPDAPSHSNGALRYWLEDQGFLPELGAKAEPSHRAGPDTYVTAHLLKVMLQTTTASQMVAWTKQPAIMPKINFGKHKGPWTGPPADYLEWIVEKSDLDADTKWNAQREIDRRRQEKAA